MMNPLSRKGQDRKGGVEVYRTAHYSADSVETKWYLIDATDQILGRLASKIAKLLMGKHKPEYTPSSLVGDFVIVVNADKIKVTGKKMRDKKYYFHSGYLGNLKELSLRQMMERSPERVIRLAVSGMLPKNKLRKRMLKRLKIYRGPEHPHSAQKPIPIKLEDIK